MSCGEGKGGKGCTTRPCWKQALRHDRANDPTEFSLPRFQKKEREERIKTYTVGRRTTSFLRVKPVQP
jgi:hypothetical protein